MHMINTNVRTTKQLSYRTLISGTEPCIYTLNSHRQPPGSYFSLRPYELHTFSTVSPA